MNLEGAGELQNLPSQGWLEIGKIIAAHGIKGEVRVYPDTDFPERFMEPGQRWLRHSNEKEPQPVELLRGRYIPDKGLYVLQLAGVENRNQAEALRGCIVLVPASDRPLLEEDEYHVLDLIGLEVFNQLNGQAVGRVVDILPAGNYLLVVSSQSGAGSDELLNNKGKKTKGKEVLIPFVKEIVPVVDLQNRRIEIAPPPGLLEIN